MRAFVKAILIGFLLFNSAVWCGTVRAEAVPYDEFIKQFYARVSEGDFKTIYKDLSTSRFKSTSDFATFQDAMSKINTDLGTIKSFEKEYVFEDNQYQRFNFIRLQLRVKQERGDSVQRMVLMQDNGVWLLDGYAVYNKGQFLIARGNLYNFDALDEKLAQEQPAEAKGWANLRDDKEYQDTFNYPAALAKFQQKYKTAITLASDGNFDEADKIIKEALILREVPSDSPDAKVIQDVQDGKLSEKSGQMYFQAVKAVGADRDIKKAIYILEKGAALKTGFNTSYIMLAVLYLDQKRPQRAYRWIRKVLATEPDNIFARQVLVRYYTAIGDTAKMKKEFKAVYAQVADSSPMARSFIEQGFEKKYFSDGKVEFEATFVNGHPNGPYKAYFSSGEIKEEGQYRDGELDGEGKVYFKSGKTSMEFKYDKGRLMALKEYSESGAVIADHKL